MTNAHGQSIQTALTNGDFTVARLGWIADYFDATNFLDIYISQSGNNHPQLGKKGLISAGANFGPNHDQTWLALYDNLIDKIKTTADLKARAVLMYQAETALKDTWSVSPIYYYTQPYLQSTKLTGVVKTPLGVILFKTATLAK